MSIRSTVRAKSLRVGKFQLNPWYVPPVVVVPRHQIGNILASFDKVIADLEALREQNNREHASNTKTIESLTQTNQALSTEVTRATTVHGKLRELIAG